LNILKKNGQFKLGTTSLEPLDPFGGAKARLLRRGKETPLRVNPCLRRSGFAQAG